MGSQNEEIISSYVASCCMIGEKLFYNDTLLL